jgi:hypothetical protein
MTERQQDTQAKKRTRPAAAIRRGLLVAGAALAIGVPLAVHHAPAFRNTQNTQATDSAPAKRQFWQLPRHAEFGSEEASRDVRRLAHWVADSRDNGKRSFVILDKAGAKVFLFDPSGRLQASAPALLGAAHGDDSAPGIGEKPLKEILPEEKTTPAGRFVAEVGESSSRGEDVVWVDYNAAVSMHRIIKVPERLHAISTPAVDDNRMSFGCVNLPDAFYEGSLRPAVDKTGAIIYVLPETRPLERTFASFYDVDAPTKLAQH